MPDVYKKPSDSFVLTGTVKNVGEVAINLQIAVVLSGPKTYGLSVKDIGTLPIGGSVSIYYSDVVPSEAPEGRYNVLVSAIDKTDGKEFQRIDTTWDIIVHIPTKKIELLNVSVS